jgi:hypothetical protein
MAALVLIIVAVGWMIVEGRRKAMIEREAAARMHPWWKVDTGLANQYFEEGRDLRRRGVDLADIQPGVSPGQTVERATVLRSASLFAPIPALKTAGWVAEDEHWSDEDALRGKLDMLLLTSSRIVFQLVLAADSIRISDAQGYSFLLETERGDKVTTEAPATAEVKRAAAPSREQEAHYMVGFPLRNQQERLNLDRTTQWVTLWVIGHERRMPLRFWLDGSMKAEAGAPIAN